MQEEDGCDEGDGEDDDDVGVTITTQGISEAYQDDAIREPPAAVGSNMLVSLITPRPT